MKPKSMAVRRALQALERAGKLTPSEVVSAARDPESPLHNSFEWDDAKAAESWRLVQARELIRSVQVQVSITEDRVISVPVYVRDSTVPEDEQGYVSLSSIKDNPQAARAALYLELTRVEGLLGRAESIAEACGLSAEVHRVAKRVKSLRKRVEPEANA